MELFHSNANIRDSHKIIIALIPAYNEQYNIKSTVLNLPNVVETVLIVNDGSSDNTGQEIIKLEHELKKELIYIEHNANLGKGSAILSGFKWIQNNFKENYSDFDIAIVLIDGDGQMNTNYILQMTTPIFEKQAEFVKASRFRQNGHSNNMPKIRYFGSQALKVLNWIASGHWNITDPQNGYFALSLEALKDLDLSKIDNGYFFENSMLIETGKLGHHIIEVPVPAIYGVGEKSNLRYWQFIPKTSMNLLFGWMDRIVTTANKNLSRKLSFYAFIVSILFIILSISSIIFQIININYEITTFFSLSIIFLLLSFILDFIDYKNRFDPSK